MHVGIVFGGMRLDVEAGLPASTAQEVHAADHRLIHFQQLDDGVRREQHVAFRHEDMRESWFSQQKGIGNRVLC